MMKRAVCWAVIGALGAFSLLALTGASRVEEGAFRMDPSVRMIRKTGSYAVKVRDEVIVCAPTAPMTITLLDPTGRTGRPIAVVNLTGAYPVTVLAEDGALIGGEASMELALAGQWLECTAFNDAYLVSVYPLTTAMFQSIIVDILTSAANGRAKMLASIASLTAYVTTTNSDSDHLETILDPVELAGESPLAAEGDSLLIRFAGVSSLNANLKGVGVLLLHDGALMTGPGVATTDNFTLGANAELRITRMGTSGATTTFLVTGFSSRVSSAAALTYTPITVGANFTVDNFDPTKLSFYGYGFCETSGTVALRLVQVENHPAPTE